MIKYAAIFGLLLFALISCDKRSDTFVLEGSINGDEIPESVLLSYYSLHDNGEWYEILDTAQISDGKFVFEGKIDGLTLAYINFDNSYAEIYIEPCRMKLSFDIDKIYAYELSGTSVDKENSELRKMIEPYDKIGCEKSAIAGGLVDQINSADNSSARDSLINIIRGYSKELSDNNIKRCELILDFVSKHNTYQIAPALLYSVSRLDFMNMDAIKSVYNSFPEKLKISPMGKLVYRRIQQLENKPGGMVGDPAPDFERENTLEQTIRLSDSRDKSYVLLDFWASWCGPCIKEIPNLNNIHRKYGDKLQIISVSTDEDKNSWYQAIEKHDLKNWPQILSTAYSDGRLFNEDVSDMYSVEYLPTFVLIDKEGKVVARWNNLGEEQLQMLNDMLLE